MNCFAASLAGGALEFMHHVLKAKDLDLLWWSAVGYRLASDAP
jgi:hypothetical protein